MNQFKLTALALAASLALFPSLSLAQQPPNAYGGASTGHFIVPNYYLLQGSYAKGLTSGTIGAGIAANSPIYAFQYTPTVVGSIAVIRRVTISAASLTAFAAGDGNFKLFAARAFTAADTGGTAGTVTGNNGKLRTSFATTGVGQIMIANTGTNTAGTRTLDTDPLGAIEFGFSGTPVADSAFVGPSSALFDPKNAGDTPLMLANNEGFVIQVNVPATGTWIVTVNVQWDEFSQY